MNEKTIDETKKIQKASFLDRLGLREQWKEDIAFCSKTLGTELYPTAVKRFKYNIPNIHDGTALRDIIQEYENKIEEKKREQLQIFKQNFPEMANDEAVLRSKKKDIEMWGYELLYQFMLQLLEDYGFLTYKSRMIEDEATL